MHTFWVLNVPLHRSQPPGSEGDLELQCSSSDLSILHSEDESTCSLLDLDAGRIHGAELNSAFLLQVLRSDSSSRWEFSSYWTLSLIFCPALCPSNPFLSCLDSYSIRKTNKICRLHSRCPSAWTDPQRLAALHCLLVYMGNDPKLELKVTVPVRDSRSFSRI